MPAHHFINGHLVAEILLAAFVPVRAYIVEVVDFPWNIVHSPTSELQQREKERMIGGVFVEIAFVVL